MLLSPPQRTHPATQPQTSYSVATHVMAQAAAISANTLSPKKTTALSRTHTECMAATDYTQAPTIEKYAVPANTRPRPGPRGTV